MRKIAIKLIFSTIITGVLGCVAIAQAQRSSKVTVLWCDPLLNLQQIYSRSGIVSILDKMESSGIGAIALGVKTIAGEVIYESNVAPRLTEWETYRIPIDFDPVQTFLDEAKIRQIQIYAVLSVFSEGHIINRQGPVFDTHPEWQSQVYVVEDEKPVVIPLTQWTYSTSAFVNPLSEEVQAYELSIIKEFLRKYSVDGVILDKIRFSGIESDFSDLTRARFQAFLGAGRSLHWWPEDVYELQLTNDEWQISPGPYFKDWIQFRSQSIRSFMAKVIEEIRLVDQALPIGNFVGAWYPTYYEYGVNWASESTIPEEEWASTEYYKTAFAELLDYLVVGCYFPRITIEETEKVGAEWWMSTEGSAMVSMEVVNNVCPVYGSVLIDLFKNDRALLKQALTVVLDHTNGLYIYDLSHVESYKLWDDIREVLSNP